MYGLPPAVAEPVTVGAVKSILTGPNDSGALVATLPALSEQEPLALVPAIGVSCVKVCDPEGDPAARPEFTCNGEALSTQA